MTSDLYIFSAACLGILLSAVLGGNNFSTCLGLSLGARIIKPLNAIMIASAGVLVGTFLEGQKLSTVLGGQILPALSSVDLMVILVVSLVIMAAVTAFQLPLSLSQIIVGAAWGLVFATGTQANPSFSFQVITSWILSPVVAFLGSAIIETTTLQLGRRVRNIMTLNRLYANLTLLAGFYAAYALGANTLGLLVGMFPTSVGDPLLLSLLFSASTIFGIFFLSQGTVRSVSDNLVGLNPSTALSAQFGGAASAHLFTQLGLPVSLSQVVIGGMEGAASVKRIAITNKRLLVEIIAGWTVGPVLGAIASFLLMKAI